MSVADSLEAVTGSVHKATLLPQNMGQTEEFPFGSVTLSLPDWNTLVSYIEHIHKTMRPLKIVLSHIELGSDPREINDVLDGSSSSLWSGYHTLEVLNREIQRHEGR